MKINAPTIGPIVGYTSDSEARLWLRGELHRTPDGYRRCFGVARIRQSKAKAFGDPFFVKLQPHFDMTGVCVFTKLQADCVYEYEIGFFFAETELENLDSAQLLDWRLAAAGTFKSASSLSTQPRTYALGSCRYLLRLFGKDFCDTRGDKIFQSILNQKQSGAKYDGLLMIGDQIYADDLSVIVPDTSIDQYLERYRSVFSQPSIKELMGGLPTYMILDDHEIENDWPKSATSKDWLTKYPAAMHAYQIYQCSHSPIFGLDAKGRIEGTPDRYWYSFRDGCCDFFVTDCRTERYLAPDDKNSRIISTNQLNALMSWLDDKSGNVKVVVSSVPVFPDLIDDSSDKWSGFLTQRSKLLDHIYSLKIRKVVFLSGDVHCSFSVELNSKTDPQFKIISIVSSSFYWPYPHMEDGDFQFAGRLKTDKGIGPFYLNAPSACYSTDNFAKIEFDTSQVSISYFARKGDPLGAAVVRKY